MNILDKVLQRHRSMRACFCNPDGSLTRDGELVLKYLSAYCQPVAVIGSDGRVDQAATMTRIGRNEVLNYISKALSVDEARIRKIAQENNDD